MTDEAPAEPQGLLRAMNDLLRVAALQPDLLRREAFEALAAALARHTSLGRLVVMVPDGDQQILYACSVGDGASSVPPFGARFPLPDAKNRPIVMEGSVRICRDTRQGDRVDRMTAEAGYLSYAALPIRDPLGAPDRVFAKLIACFPEVDHAARVPMALLEQAAALFGAGFGRSRGLARDRRLAMILETSGEAMLAWGRSTRVMDANAAALRLTGLTRAELMERTISELVQPLPESTAQPGRAVRTRLLVRRADGLWDWLPVSASVTSVPDDPLIVAHLLLRDESHVVLAEREAAQHLERVRALELEHRTLLDNAPLVIFRLDPSTRELRYLNRHAERLLGVRPEEVPERPDFLRRAHASARAADAFDAACLRAECGRPSPPYEVVLVKPDGEEIIVQSSIYPLVVDGKVVAIEGLLADVSAEHAARRQLVQTDRLSTLGRLAAGVAHEINNPAGFLMLGLEQLQAELTALGNEPPAVAEGTLELLGQLRESLQRIVDIVRDLKLFAGPAQVRPGTAAADVQRSLESALTLTRSQIIERAELRLRLEPVPAAAIDQRRLAQVLVNLLMNAAQAIPDERRAHAIEVTLRAVPEGVEVAVSDTGEGIRPADQARIWGPFFTTKESGTGLGLSISREIIENAGGRMEVTSPTLTLEDGRQVGTRFVVRLRRAEQDGGARGRAAATEPPSQAPRPRGPRLRILVVDDDPSLAGALAHRLRAEHEVRVAHDGRAALELLRSEAFDVVLCDLQMPELSGEALYLRARELGSGYAQRFIFMTGGSLSGTLGRLRRTYHLPVLEKPFESETLIRTVAEVTDAPVADAATPK